MNLKSASSKYKINPVLVAVLCVMKTLITVSVSLKCAQTIGYFIGQQVWKMLVMLTENHISLDLSPPEKEESNTGGFSSQKQR